jgi:hypothetical protein
MAKTIYVTGSVLLAVVISLSIVLAVKNIQGGGGDEEQKAPKLYGGTNVSINFWFDDTSPAYFNTLLPKIAATRSHIKIGVHHLMDPAPEYTITPMDDADFSVIRMCIEKAQSLGIKVDMLMIFIEYKDDWRKQIEPTGADAAAFFKSHKAAAMKVAALCDLYCIPIIGLINESDALTDSDKALYWADEANTLKTAYPKLLLSFASTTWNGETRKLLDYKKNGIDNICNYLDLLGVNLYPTLTEAPLKDVTEDDLKNGWYGMDYPNASTWDCSIVQLLENTYEAYGKPILISETGCVPKELGLADPLKIYPETQDSADNKHVQYLYIKTAFDVLGSLDFVAGIFIWDACDTWTPFYWLDNTELVPYITKYNKQVFNRSRIYE